jgi:hypothetical protein
MRDQVRSRLDQASHTGSLVDDLAPRVAVVDVALNPGFTSRDGGHVGAFALALPVSSLGHRNSSLFYAVLRRTAIVEQGREYGAKFAMN